MSNPGWALQKALYGALSADVPLTTLLGGAAIYDRAPPDAAFPYLTFSAATGLDWSTQTQMGTEHSLVIDVWSRNRGRGEALDIASAVTAAIAAATLSLSGFTLVNLNHEATDVALDEDGETFHAALRYRAVTETGA